MKILAVEIPKWQQEEFVKLLPGHQVVFSETVFTKDQVNAENSDAEVLSTFTTTKVSADLLEVLPNLKLVATRTTGFDHIDLSACKAKGVLVSNVPSYGENTVAEFAFGLLLTLSRKLYWAIHRTKDENKFSFDGLLGFDLEGKTLGVVGTGKIGRHMVSYAKGFGMKVIAYDPFPNKELQDSGLPYLTLPELLAESDVVTVHVPYSDSTHHLLGAEQFKQIKPGAVVINTARGGIVDTEALLVALKSGKLGGAALDVVEDELAVREESANTPEDKTLLGDYHELQKMPNVVITPHSAFQTKEALIRILNTAAGNINEFNSSGKVLNPIE